MRITHLALRAALAVAALAFSVVLASPADASTEDALARCRNLWGPDSAMSLTLDGKNSGWTPVQLSTLRPGNVVRLVGTGRVHYGGFLGMAGEWGPDGNGIWNWGREWNYPGASEYSVAAWWNPTGDLVRFHVCTILGSGHVGAPQMLLLGINDIWDAFGDNRGAYNVGVWVFHA